MNYIIRKAEYKDIESIAKIKVDGWRKAYQGIIREQFLNDMDYPVHQEKARKIIDDQEYTMIVYENVDTKEILGYASYGKRQDLLDQYIEYDGELTSIYIKPTHQYQGIGTLLFKESCVKLKEKGYQKMILWVITENKPSIMFYERLGGKYLGDKKEELRGEILDEIAYGFEL